ncbi:MAG: YkgJ family cysteine cluster protein [Cyanobacteria bacterium P01_D01_bin.73]
MAEWKCIEKCGACCYLEPSDRPDLDAYLPPKDFQHYLSMVGEDGWCINFDRDKRRCKIYSDRPWFCRVDAQTFKEMFAIPESEMDEFAIECCYEQIGTVYGDRSPEMERYCEEVDLSVENA